MRTLSCLLFLGLAVASYAPHEAPCFSEKTMARPATSLNEFEAEWLQERDKITLPALHDWLSKSNLTGVDTAALLKKEPIRVAIALSGGSYRSAISGSGQIAALDARTPGSDQKGHLGGMLQAATYFSSVSGGSFLLSALVFNNWTTPLALHNSANIWNFQNNLLNLYGNDIPRNVNYYVEIFNAVMAKANTGINASLSDIWGLALGHQLLDSPQGGQGLTFSGIRDIAAFKSHQMPFPIEVATVESADKKVNLTTPVVEMNPFEFGSWDPIIHSFADIEYIGSPVNAGTPNGPCIAGYDQATFLTGASSSLLNGFLLRFEDLHITGVQEILLRQLLRFLSAAVVDVAIVEPNPFKGLPGPYGESDWLGLADGGEDYENVPLQPLIQPERKVDIILAFDNSGDTPDNYPDGTALRATYKRQFLSQGNGIKFPDVPQNNSQLKEPLFIGCASSDVPLLVYIPNSPLSYTSNASTFKFTYTDDEVAGYMTNGYNTATRLNGTLNGPQGSPEWRTCLACATILRAQQRSHEASSSQCSQCFSHYCY